MNGKSKKIAGKIGLYVILTILALVWIVPIFTLVATALKHKKDFISGLSLFQLPASIAWDNFTNAITQGRLLTYMKNDLIISFLKVPLGILVGSLAACLSAMVIQLTYGKKKYLEYSDELTALLNKTEYLRDELLKCIDKDAQAFEPLAKAYSLPKDSEGYEEKMETCLKNAADSPFQILKYTAETIEIGQRLSQIGAKIAVSDAACSLMLAHAVLYGAYVNILVNTRLMKDQEYAFKLNEEALAIVNTYATKALQAYDAVCERLS